MLIDPRAKPDRNHQGIVYVAIGAGARRQVEMSVNALRQLNSAPLPATVYSDAPFILPAANVAHYSDDPGWGGRLAKMSLDVNSPYAQTVYLDADTRPRAALAPLLTPLSAGYDLVIAPSDNQGASAFNHVDPIERTTTLDALGYTPVQFQAGVFAFADTPAVHQFFAAWREEWYAGAATEDQAAFVRALHRQPLKLWVLSQGLIGQLVLHLYGALRGPESMVPAHKPTA